MKLHTITRSSLVALALVNILLFLPGCPGVVNQAPVANAGSNQNVSANALVTLNGLASIDPDGNPLTFSWTQIGGANNVVLTSPNTAVTTFTAPNANDALQFQLTVSDGTLSSSASTTVTVAATSPPPPSPTPTPTTPKLYIANIAGNNVTSYDNPSTVNGNIVPDTNLAGAQTGLVAPSDIVIDAGGALLASNLGGIPAITAYDNAAATNGNLAPNRNVQGAATLLVAPFTLAVNTASDLVFVGDGAANAIHVYGNASSAAFNGNLAPIRQILSASLNFPFGINFDASDNLYVANRGNNNVLVFANASNTNGTVAPTRILNSIAFTDVVDVFIDPSDRMYVVDSVGMIHVFNNAATRNGAVMPDFALTIPGAGFLTAIAVDQAGVGYIVDNAMNAVYSYDNIATLNGVLPPDRTIAGVNTQLLAPIRVYLQE